MPSILRYSTSFSEPWVAWTMLLLLAVLLFANLVQRGIVLDGFQSITIAKERENLFSDVSKSVLGNICVIAYEIGILSICLYMIFVTDSFSWLDYLIIMALTSLIAIVKYLSMRLVAYVFLPQNMLATIIMHKDGINLMVSVLLYPIVLFGLFLSPISQTAIIVMLVILLIFAIFVWLLKAFQLFFTNYLAGFYIFLYLCTLEIVPYAVLILLVRFLVQ